MKTFGILLKKLRLRKEWTLDELASKVGCRKGYLSGIESGALNPPSIKIVRRLAKIFKMDVRSLAWMAWREKAPKPIRDAVLRATLPDAASAESIALTGVPLLDQPGRSLGLSLPPAAGKLDGAVTLDRDFGRFASGDVLLLRQESEPTSGALAYVVVRVNGKEQAVVRTVWADDGKVRLQGPDPDKAADVIPAAELHEYYRVVGRITIGL